jgi:hypothetical protein
MPTNQLLCAASPNRADTSILIRAASCAFVVGSCLSP